MKRPYAALFYTLLLTIGTLPLVRAVGLPDWPVNLLLALALLGASITVAEGYRRGLLIGLIVVVVVARLVGQWLGWGSSSKRRRASPGPWWRSPPPQGPSASCSARGPSEASICTPRSAPICLVGMFMGVLFAAIGARSPEAFVVLGAPASPDNFSLASAVYFSFVTLATLGYGDIVPTAEATRGLAVIEAVGGQLYLAVLVASLIRKRDAPRRS